MITKRGATSRAAQAWVETVVYTLIGLSIMGIVIGIATPKIKQMTDKAIIEQTMVAMNEIDQKVGVVQTTQGQSREIDIRIKKGKFTIGSGENKLSFILEDTGLRYSQPGTEIPQGGIIILTEEKGKKYDVSLTLDYSANGLDITFDSTQDDKTLTQAPTAYRMLIENKGSGNMDISLI